MIDYQLVAEAEDRLKLETTAAHTAQRKVADALEAAQEECERMHSFSNCDHEWVEGPTTLHCHRCHWTHYIERFLHPH